MYSYFSDLHVDLLARAVLEPGEQRLGATVGRYMPWWALGLINETYLVIATDRRVVLVEHRMAFFHLAQRVHSVDSIPWQAVQEAKVKGIFGKKLVLKGRSQSREVNRKLRVPAPLFGLLAPMRGNVAGARAVAGAYASARGLGPAPALATLPATPYGVPAPVQMLPPAAMTTPMEAYAPQAAAYAQPPSIPVPATNAPGYTSVPPASAQPVSRGIPPLPPRPSAGPRQTY